MTNQTNPDKLRAEIAHLEDQADNLFAKAQEKLDTIITQEDIEEYEMDQSELTSPAKAAKIQAKAEELIERAEAKMEEFNTRSEEITKLEESYEDISEYNPEA